jgi:hypothetical protein
LLDENCFQLYGYAKGHMEGYPAEMSGSSARSTIFAYFDIEVPCTYSFAMCGTNARARFTGNGPIFDFYPPEPITYFSTCGILDPGSYHLDIGLAAFPIEGKNDAMFGINFKVCAVPEPSLAFLLCPSLLLLPLLRRKK